MFYGMILRWEWVIMCKGLKSRERGTKGTREQGNGEDGIAWKGAQVGIERDFVVVYKLQESR